MSGRAVTKFRTVLNKFRKALKSFIESLTDLKCSDSVSGSLEKVLNNLEVSLTSLSQAWSSRVSCEKRVRKSETSHEQCFETCV